MPTTDHIHAQRLLIDLPPQIDLDELADAFVTFADTSFEDRHPHHQSITEAFSWSEVTADQFDATYAELAGTADQAPWLQAIWAEGLFCVLAQPNTLTGPQWNALQTVLIQSQEAADARGWRVLRSPLDDEKPAGFEKVDRHAPVMATPEQQKHVTLGRQQDVPRHPAVTIAPIYLSSPDTAALEAAFEILQERHEVLHMSFVDFDGAAYLQLNDTAPTPFDVHHPIRPFQDLTELAALAVNDLADALQTSGPLWMARLIIKEQRAAVVVVLSQAIADQRSAQLLRSELITIYETLQSRSDPNQRLEPLDRQFIDFAGADKDLRPQFTWWDDLLPTAALDHKAEAKPPVAPVAVWNQDITADVAERLLLAAKQDILKAKAIVLYAFLRAVSQSNQTLPDWVTTNHDDRDTALTAGMLGPLTFDCPVWLGDMHQALTPQDLRQRLRDTHALGAIRLPDLRDAMADRVPNDIRYRLDWQQGPVCSGLNARPEDVALTIWTDDTTIRAQWAIRMDHPLSAQESQMRAAFQQVLT